MGTHFLRHLLPAHISVQRTLGVHLDQCQQVSHWIEKVHDPANTDYLCGFDPTLHV